MCKYLLQFFGFSFGLLFGLTQCIKPDRHLPKCFKFYGGLGRVGYGKISIWSNTGFEYAMWLFDEMPKRDMASALMGFWLFDRILDGFVISWW